MGHKEPVLKFQAWKPWRNDNNHVKKAKEMQGKTEKISVIDMK